MMRMRVDRKMIINALYRAKADDQFAVFAVPVRLFVPSNASDFEHLSKKPQKPHYLARVKRPKFSRTP